MEISEEAECPKCELNIAAGRAPGRDAPRGSEEELRNGVMTVVSTLAEGDLCKVEVEAFPPEGSREQVELEKRVWQNGSAWTIKDFEPCVLHLAKCFGDHWPYPDMSIASAYVVQDVKAIGPDPLKYIQVFREKGAAIAALYTLIRTYRADIGREWPGVSGAMAGGNVRLAVALSGDDGGNRVGFTELMLPPGGNTLYLVVNSDQPHSDDDAVFELFRSKAAAEARAIEWEAELAKGGWRQGGGPVVAVHIPGYFPYSDPRLAL